MGVKCFKCQKIGHMAKNCVESKSNPYLRTVDSLEAKKAEFRTDQDDELWLRTIVAEPDSQAMVLQVAMKGPTYKAVS